MDYSNILKRLDFIRKKNSLTWRDFGEKINLKQSTISGYVHGRPIPLAVLAKISGAFSMSLAYILEGAGAEEIEREIIIDHRPRMEFSLRLCDLMGKKNITATYAAKKIGASRAQLSNWMRGKNFPGSPYAARLAGLLGVTKDYLITGKTFERHETIYPPELGIRNQDLGNKNTNISARSGKCPADKLGKMFHDLTTDQELCNDLISYYEYLLNKKTKQEKSGESGSGESSA